MDVDPEVDITKDVTRTVISALLYESMISDPLN